MNRDMQQLLVLASSVLLAVLVALVCVPKTQGVYYLAGSGSSTGEVSVCLERDWIPDDCFTYKNGAYMEAASLVTLLNRNRAWGEEVPR